jgi:hypothetical protein
MESLHRPLREAKRLVTSLLFCHFFSLNFFRLCFKGFGYAKFDDPESALRAERLLGGMKIGENEILVRY